MAVDSRRIRFLNDNIPHEGPVVYVMSRDQRAEDNWALLYAQEVALERKVPLLVVFVLRVLKNRSGVRQYDFMLRGLKETAEVLAEKNISFFCVVGDPTIEVPRLIKRQRVGEVVVDFSPLRHGRQLRAALAAALSVRVTEVDAHNIVPAWVVSPKEEFAAYTFRPKITKLLPEFLVEYPKLKQHPFGERILTPIDWSKMLKKIPLDAAIAPVSWCVPGTGAARKMLATFCTKRLPHYDTKRNDPNADGQSNLSPYLHYGQLSAQRVALTVKAAAAPKVAKEAYFEELIVRRELADNFCFYNSQYDRVAGAHPWAQQTIKEHADDRREIIYTRDELEAAATHDELWNAAERQMICEGKMHGWCRMYWAKKILEWTPDTQTAINYALYLNDKYELDGADPNGVVGVMWSLAGVHDRAWNERPIFGKIRYMNYAGAKRKFNVAAYVARYSKETTLF